MVAAEFKQSRSDFGLGASEVAAAIGLSPYETPFELWSRKVHGTEKASTDAMEIGTLAEPMILSLYEKRCEPGISVRRCESSVFSPTTIFARATPDAWRMEGETIAGVVQLKNVGHRMTWAWRDQPPEYVVLQVQWELYVTALRRGDVAALLGGSEFRAYTVWRDDALISDLVKAAAAFWRHVEAKTEPPTDESDACRDHWIGRMGDAVLANDPDVDRLARVLREEKAKAKAAKLTIARTNNLIAERMALAGARVAHTSEGVLSVATRRGSVSWKKVVDSAGLTHLGEQFRGKDTHYLRSPREWSSEDDDE